MAEKKDSGKKQIVLRLSPKLWTDLADWAEDDFRSINGQIEFLLTECVKKRGLIKSVLFFHYIESFAILFLSIGPTRAAITILTASPGR